MTAPQSELPLHLGSDEEFSALRTALAAAEFTEKAVCWRMNFKHISDFPLDGKLPEGATPTDKIGALVWLLMYGAPLDASVSDALAIAELRALGVVTDNPGGRVISTVMLYPTCGLWISSDRPNFAGDPDSN